jgi:hypothetical protein
LQEGSAGRRDLIVDDVVVGVGPADFTATDRQLVDEHLAALRVSVKLVVKTEGFLGFGGKEATASSRLVHVSLVQ